MTRPISRLTDLGAARAIAPPDREVVAEDDGRRTEEAERGADALEEATRAPASRSELEHEEADDQEVTSPTTALAPKTATR